MFDNLPLIGGFLTWASQPHLVLMLVVMAALLYVTLGKALWTLMFITDPDRDCELRRAALSKEGVPLSVYCVFLMLWPLMLAVPLYRGELLLGRRAPEHNRHATGFSLTSVSTSKTYPMRT